MVGKHKRRWFEYDDGTYFRNCPLIAQERDEAIRHLRHRLARRLMDEWDATFSRGVQYKDALGPDEVSAGRAGSSLRVTLPGLIGQVPDEDIDRWDAMPMLPGEEKYRWCYQW